MASIGLPQESLHPSYLSIDLYATTLDLQFVSAQQSADDSRQRRLQVCGEFVVADGRNLCRSEEQNLSYEPRWAP